jgi:hypothetical protein
MAVICFQERIYGFSPLHDDMPEEQNGSVTERADLAKTVVHCAMHASLTQQRVA